MMKICDRALLIAHNPLIFNKFVKYHSTLSPLGEMPRSGRGVADPKSEVLQGDAAKRQRGCRSQIRSPLGEMPRSGRGVADPKSEALQGRCHAVAEGSPIPNQKLQGRSRFSGRGALFSYTAVNQSYISAQGTQYLPKTGPSQELIYQPCNGLWQE